MRVNKKRRLRKTAEELLSEINVINFDEDKKSSSAMIIEEILKSKKLKDGNSKKKLYRIESSFDTETTNHENHGYIWIWQFGLGDKFFYGRNWEDFAELMKNVSEIIEADLIVAIANAGFDLSFYDCFFKDLETEDTHTYEQINAAPHQPILSELKAKGNKASIKFVDICKISNMSLENIAKNYCKHKKLVGTLDYSKVRTPQTTIKTHELAYSLFDVVVANEYVDYLFKEFTEKGEKFPITATSICRQKVKIESEKEEYETIKSKVAKELFPKTYKEYEQVVKYLFRGGFTHANSSYVNKVLHNVTCADYTSSYPSEMIYQNYPMSEFTRLEDIEGIYECDEGELPHIKIFYDKHFCSKCEITLYNLHARFSHTIESEHKMMNLYPNKNGKQTHITDNGRLFYAKKVTMMVTELDYDILRKFYYADKIEIQNLYISTAGKLPGYVTKPLIEMYARKSQLKANGLQETAEYTATKGMVNAFYGMLVQKLKMFSDVLEREYDEDFNYYYQYNHVDNSRKLLSKSERFIKYTYEELQDAEYYIQKRDKILSVYWGVWVTAYARHKLLSQIYEIEERSMKLFHHESVVYCDTDSMYIKNIEHFKDILDKYNSEIIEKNKKNLPDGCEDLNTLDIDPPCEYFKTLGAKRYVKTYFDKKKKYEQVTKVTIAGLPKASLLEFCDYDRERIYNEFKDGMIIDKTFSHKMTRVCKYEKYEADITDYEGNTMKCKQYGGCVLKEIEFSLDASEILKFVECYVQRQG